MEEIIDIRPFRLHLNFGKEVYIHKHSNLLDAVKEAKQACIDYKHIGCFQGVKIVNIDGNTIPESQGGFTYGRNHRSSERTTGGQGCGGRGA